jgi:hypothetical protein
MARTQTASHPFALLLDPASVFLAVEQSQRLEGLQRRVCRPLDRPLLPVTAGSADAQAEDEVGDDEDQEFLEASNDLGDPNA